MSVIVVIVSPLSSLDNYTGGVEEANLWVTRLVMPTRVSKAQLKPRVLVFYIRTLRWTCFSGNVRESIWVDSYKMVMVDNSLLLLKHGTLEAPIVFTARLTSIIMYLTGAHGEPHIVRNISKMAKCYFRDLLSAKLPFYFSCEVTSRIGLSVVFWGLVTGILSVSFFSN